MLQFALRRPLFSGLKQCSGNMRHFSTYDVAAQETLDKLYSAIKGQRFEDIVVIQTKFNANPRYLIFANAFSHRHLVNGTAAINREFKIEIKAKDQNFGRLSIADEWNVLDYDAVVVHLFSKNCRRSFDLDQLWTVGEEYDDLYNFPTTDSAVKEAKS